MLIHVCPQKKTQKVLWLPKQGHQTSFISVLSFKLNMKKRCLKNMPSPFRPNMFVK